MRCTLTWLPKEKAFRVRREDGEVAYIPAPMFRELVRGATAFTARWIRPCGSPRSLCALSRARLWSARRTTSARWSGRARKTPLPSG